MKVGPQALFASIDLKNADSITKRSTKETRKMEQAIAALAQSQQQTAQAQQQMATLITELMGRQNQPWMETAYYKDREDINDFLESFEGAMHVQQIEDDQWVCLLVPPLQGRPREGCAGLTLGAPIQNIRILFRVVLYCLI